MVEINRDDIIEGPFWPERVQVRFCERVGRKIKIEVVGCTSQKSSELLLRESQLEEIRKVSSATGEQWDFRGHGKEFFLGLEAHRVRLAHQFDPLLAVNVSQVDPLPHQIEAVYHNILRSPRIRFLLADDPGAGKTVMAGLLLKELKYRGLVRRTLIVVPGHLKDQWRREMQERFRENFVVVDRGYMNAAWGSNAWQQVAQVVTSLDFAKQEDVLLSLSETHWDLVIVDEAHKMAAYRYGEKINKTERYRVGEVLSRIAEFLLFLTATPHRGDPENFRLLLNLLVPDLFANESILHESVANRENPILLRRLKEDLKDFKGQPLFPPRHVSTRLYRLNEDEKRLYNAVTQYVGTYFNRARASEKRNVTFALLVLQRRLASSVRAVRRSLERRTQRLKELLRQGDWLAQRADVDEEDLEDAPEQERLTTEDELLQKLTAAETREELEEEIRRLEELIALARSAERNEIETKLNELHQVITAEQIRQTDEKLLIFTESRDTLDYLVEKLRGWGFSVVSLHGGMNLDARIQAESEFRNRAQLMVSTEAGGEGINLQFCSLMVNYDIPWNPNRLEQRMGRIHRYGQTKEVHIYNLVSVDTREGQVFHALFKKLENTRRALGSDRVFDIIGEILPRGNLKDLIVDAISNRRAMQEILHTIEAVPNDELIRKAKEATQEMLATRHIDLTRVLGEDRRAREHRLVPEYIEQFFSRACEWLQISLEQRRGKLWRVARIPHEIKNVSHDFENRFGKVFPEYQKIAFDKEQSRKLGAEFVAPGHPLLEAVVDRLLTTTQQTLHRGAVFADPEGRRDGWLWFFEVEIRDGNDQCALRKLVTIFQPHDGSSFQEVNSSILWDMKPLEGVPLQDGRPSQGQIEEFICDDIIDRLQQEIQSDRNRIGAIKRKYGMQSLQGRIADSQQKLMDYERRREQGQPIAEVEIHNEKRRRDELIARKEELEREIMRETTLVARMPRLLAVARIIPLASPSPEMGSDPAIEKIGMQIAMEYERAQGRNPEDVSPQYLGYDIRSIGSAGEVRYIEVKARANSGRVVLTPNEWNMAKQLREEYWLYVVENAAGTPQLNLIANPAANLMPQEESKIVRYWVDNWKEAATPA